MKWIIQQNLIKPAILQEFKEAFAALDIAYEEVKVIPFSSELPAFTPADVNIFYGSTTLMLNAYHHLTYRKGVFYDPKAFNTETYLEKWGTSRQRVISKNHRGDHNRTTDSYHRGISVTTIDRYRHHRPNRHLYH